MQTKILIKEYQGFELFEKNDGWNSYWEMWKGPAILESLDSKQEALDSFVMIVNSIPE